MIKACFSHPSSWQQRLSSVLETCILTNHQYLIHISIASQHLPIIFLVIIVIWQQMGSTCWDEKTGHTQIKFIPIHKESYEDWWERKREDYMVFQTTIPLHRNASVNVDHCYYWFMIIQCYCCFTTLLATDIATGSMFSASLPIKTLHASCTFRSVLILLYAETCPNTE
jgi:hypothetical protein